MLKWITFITTLLILEFGVSQPRDCVNAIGTPVYRTTLPKTYPQAYLRANERVPQIGRAIVIFLASQLYLAKLSPDEDVKNPNTETLTQLGRALNNIHKKHGIPIRFGDPPEVGAPNSETGIVKYITVEELRATVSNLTGAAFDLIDSFMTETQSGYLLNGAEGRAKFAQPFQQFRKQLWDEVANNPSEESLRFWTVIFNAFSSETMKASSDDFKQNLRSRDLFAKDIQSIVIGAFEAAHARKPFSKLYLQFIKGNSLFLLLGK